MSKFSVVKKNHFWLPHREVEQLIFDFIDGNGAYTQGYIKSNTDGSYTLTVISDSAYDEFATEPFTGSGLEVMAEASNYCDDDLTDEFFNLFYQVGDAEAVKSIIADRVDCDIDSDFLKIPLGQIFFERNTFYCSDPSNIDIECRKAIRKRLESDVKCPSIEDFEKEIFNLYSEED